jgi:hypothetical protein
LLASVAVLSLLTTVTTAGAGAAITVTVPIGGNVSQAVAGVGQSGGGTVVLLPGTYYLTSSIPVYSNTTVDGAGAATILQDTPGAAGSGFTAASDGGANVTVENLTIDGAEGRNTFLSNASGGTDNPFAGAAFSFYTQDSSWYFITVQNVTARNFGLAGLVGVANGVNLINDDFYDNNPEANFAHDFYCVACVDVDINNSRFDDSQGDGIHMDFTSLGGDSIQHSEFSNDSGEGILLQGGMSGVTIEDTATDFDGDNGIDDDSVNSTFNFNRGLYDGQFAQQSFGVGPGTINGEYGYGDGYGFPGIYQHGYTQENFLSSLPAPNTYWAAMANGVVGPNPTTDWSTSVAGFASQIGEVDFNGYPNGKLDFPYVGATSTGKVSASLRYVNATTVAETMGVTVDGQSDGTVSFPPTGSSWGTASMSLPLVAGDNDVTFSVQGGVGPVLDVFQVSAPTPQVPGAPTGLTATATGPEQVDLNWTAPSGASTYTISRNGVTIANDVTTTHYSDQTIPYSGYAATYTVTAVNQGGNGGSVSASATTPPDAPADLHVSTVSAGRALSWMTVNGATGFDVKRATVEGGPYTTIATVAKTASVFSTSFMESYTDTTAAPGTTYYYVVSSVYAGGQSANSPEVGSAITPVTATPGSGQVTLNWAGPASSYTVTAAPGGNSCTSNNLPTCTITGLTNGRNYTFTITGDGGQTATATATPYPSALMTSSAGMTLWLDGADTTTEFTSPSCTGATAQPGQSVGCWADKSGAGDNFSQWSPSLQPTLGTLGGGGAPSFVAPLQALTAAGTATYRTVLIAANLAATPNGFDEMFGQTGTGYGFGIKAYDGPSDPLGTLANPTPYDWSTGTGSPTEEWTNLKRAGEPALGQAVVIADESNSPHTINATVGDYSNARGLSGQIGEVVAFKGLLTTAQLQTVENYLITKWGA